jgi:excisionase family DNA binding protein
MMNAKDAAVDPADELWDAKDAAHYLKVSRSWIYQRAESGLLPCLRIGGLVRFDPETVRAFARGKVQPLKMLPLAGFPSGKSG